MYGEYSVKQFHCGTMSLIACFLFSVVLLLRKFLICGVHFLLKPRGSRLPECVHLVSTECMIVGINTVCVYILKAQLL